MVINMLITLTTGLVSEIQISPNDALIVQNICVEIVYSVKRWS